MRSDEGRLLKSASMLDVDFWIEEPGRAYHDHGDGDQNPVATIVDLVLKSKLLSMILTIAGDPYGSSEQALVP